MTDKYLFAGEMLVIETIGEEKNVICVCDNDIQSILTHELYEANCYKVKGE